MSKDLKSIPSGLSDKQIHEGFTFQPNASDTLYSEEVSSIALGAMDVIEEGLKKHGVTMSGEQEDHIFLFIEKEVERFGNGQYRNHN